MKKQICALALGVLFFTGLAATSSGKSNQAAPNISPGDLLQAHNVAQRSKALSASITEAVKLTSVYGNSGGELPNFFERKVSVSVNGNAFRREKVDPLGLREQVEVFDGRQATRTVIEMGRQVEEVNQTGDAQLRNLELSIRTFGLLPILKQLSDQAAEVVYLGRTSRKEDKFEVKSATGSFILYADQGHVIRRVEAGNRVMEYADYRSVKGVLLPFIERVFVKGQLSHELVFTKIELNPVFPDGYFSREALSEVIAH